eukprot:2544219-Amphidinium_carterae.1
MYKCERMGQEGKQGIQTHHQLTAFKEFSPLKNTRFCCICVSWGSTRENAMQVKCPFYNSFKSLGPEVV